jgi:hypothetical protein
MPVESVFAFPQSVIYRTEQIEITIWDIRDLSPLPQLTRQRRDGGLRPHVSVGDVQLQKKIVEIESLHTFSRFGTRARRGARERPARKMIRNGDLSCGILQTTRGEVEASCSSPWSNAQFVGVERPAYRRGLAPNQSNDILAQRPWLLAIGQRLQREYRALEQPVHGRLAAPLKNLAGLRLNRV